VRRVHRGRKAAQTGLSTADLLAQCPDDTYCIQTLWEELRYQRDASQISGSAKQLLWKLQNGLFLFGRDRRSVTGRRKKRVRDPRKLVYSLETELVYDWSAASNILQGNHLEHLEKRRKMLKAQFRYW
jgi:hypothetical protein